MTECSSCRFHRVHRTFWERLVYRAAFECIDCKRRITLRHSFSFQLALEARCPKCGSAQLRRLNSPDKIESMSRRPWNLIQGFLGGHLYYCALCRLQFYDWRGRQSSSTRVPTEQG